MTISTQLRHVTEMGRRHAAFVQLVVASLVCMKLATLLSPTVGVGGLALVAACIVWRHQGARSGAASAEPTEGHNEAGEDYADDAREEAEYIRRRDAMRQMADSVEKQLHGLVGKVGEQAQQMRGIADEMAQIAERSGENIVSSSMAADNSVQASRALADTTAHLEGAITLIAKQMTEATDTASEAASAGAEVRSGMMQLTDQIGAISKVSNRIGSLARQTNLLALNATIEAARAGEAGRGFAVVASEVKGLARQTSVLTSEISQTIERIFSVNRDVADRVDQMEQKVSSIQSIAIVIAQAVEDQRQATTTIAANVQNSVEASTDLSARVENLTQTMMETLDQTANVHVSATDIVKSAGHLEDEMRHTITEAIRTSAPELNRRVHKRYAISSIQQQQLGCSLLLDGQMRDFQLLDLSDSGCRLSTNQAPPARATGVLHLQRLGKSMDLRVITRFSEEDKVIVCAQFVNGKIDTAALVGAEAA